MAQKTKKEIMKDIILKLHEGMSASEAKERFEREIGSITSREIAELEQALIGEGVSPEEIQKFCSVHALIFQSALEKAPATETSPYHPVYLFKLENREVEKLTGALRETIAGKESRDIGSLKRRIREVLVSLQGLDRHFQRKEQLLFPFLEKAGFGGPSKVMWGKHNEIREMLRSALSGLEGVTRAGFDSYAQKSLKPLMEEVDGMVFKEENILFPASLERLKPDDWVEILRESDDIGYAFIEKPEETGVLVRHLKAALQDETVLKDSSVAFPTGRLGLNELTAILNTLPVELTFIDRDDAVRYFSEARDRIFQRPRSVIGRKVQNCHPPQSLHVVERILASFKDGTQDSADFWITYRGRYVYIRYFAVRDRDRTYLGTLEVVQDISAIRYFQGDKRLLDE